MKARLFMVAWLLTLGAATCDGGGGGGSDAGVDGGGGGGVFDVELDWEGLAPPEPGREQRDGYTVVWLSGTPLEMGRQHGELLHDEIEWGMNESSYVDQLVSLLPTARQLGLDELALEQSYPQVVEECEGMVETAGDTGWSLELCLMVNFGDVLTEILNNSPFSHGRFEPLPTPGCSQFIAAGAATASGRLVHGRLLDWSMVDYLLEYPVIFVRWPAGEIPHATIGFPGNLSPYTGINAEGISIGSNEADPAHHGEMDDEGHSHVQMLGRLLASAGSLEDALALIEAEDHMSAEAFGAADGLERAGAAVEMTAAHLGVRRMTDGAVYLTNHFLAAQTESADADPPSSSSTLRYERLEQLLSPGGADSRHGEIDPLIAAEILRDRINPYTHEQVPESVFDNDGSLATNGALYAVVLDPGALRFWVAAGQTPVPAQPLVGFSLAELLGADDWPELDPAVME